MKPKVSIILTSYNKPNLIGKVIESVRKQTLKDWELFVMDDASNEKTTAVIKSYLSDKRIHYYNSQIKDEDRHKTVRYATLINQAIPMTKGKYLSYLTDDDLYQPDRLEIMSKLLDENSNIDIVYSSQLIKNFDHKFKLVSERLRRTVGILKEAALRVDHCSVMHTRKIAEKVYLKYGDYWDDDARYWQNADAVFWNRLNEFANFFPIDRPLDINYRTPYSFQVRNVNIPDHLPNGILVKGIQPDIYLIDNTERRKITNDLLKILKYKATEIVAISDPMLYKFPLGSPIDHTVFNDPKTFPNFRLIRGAGTPIYYIQNNKKRAIGMHAFNKYSFQTKDAIVLEQKFINNIPNGSPISHLITRNTILPDGALFQFNHSLFLSYSNLLHKTNNIIVKKLKINKKPIYLSFHEFKYFKEGPSIEWNNRGYSK